MGIAESLLLMLKSNPASWVTRPQNFLDVAGAGKDFMSSFWRDAITHQHDRSPEAPKVPVVNGGDRSVDPASLSKKADLGEAALRDVSGDSSYLMSNLYGKDRTPAEIAQGYYTEGDRSLPIREVLGTVFNPKVGKVTQNNPILTRYGTSFDPSMIKGGMSKVGGTDFAPPDTEYFGEFRPESREMRYKPETMWDKGVNWLEPLRYPYGKAPSDFKFTEPEVRASDVASFAGRGEALTPFGRLPESTTQASVNQQALDFAEPPMPLLMQTGSPFGITEGIQNISSYPDIRGAKGTLASGSQLGMQKLMELLRQLLGNRNTAQRDTLGID